MAEPTTEQIDPARVAVAGESMERTLADFERACLAHLEGAQEELNPDNALIALLCDAVRLKREYTACVRADQLTALSAENARLITERDHAFAEHGVESGFWGRAAARATQRSKRLEEENARLREALTWQPIDTAPEAELLLLYRPRLPKVSRFAIRWGHEWCGPKCCPDAEPTHWMPIPTPPPSAGETGEPR